MEEFSQKLKQSLYIVGFAIDAPAEPMVVGAKHLW